MPRIENGKNLATPVLLPGWTYSRDPFGLGTSTTRYKCDHTSNVAAFAARGQPHPDPSYSFLKANSYSVSWDSLDIATLTVDYVGIPPSVNSGEHTEPNTSGANGLTAENITSHPNFFKKKEGYIQAIAGEPPYPQDTNGLAPIVNGAPAYVSVYSGACFEKEKGGRFIGFVDPAWPSYYGKTQYLAATSTFTGVIYVSTVAKAKEILGYLNQATETRSWGSWQLLPKWAVVGKATGIGFKNLLSQVNIEEFGSLYKVTYEIRFADRGWDADVYKNIGV
jgi:hypothetical protein